jgi:protein-disulfide isomerase
MRTRLSLVLGALSLALVVPASLAAKSPTKDPAEVKPAEMKPAGDEVVATIGDLKISREELDKQAAPALAKVRQQEYDARRGALDGMIEQKLLESAAAKSGAKMTGPEWLNDQIQKRVTAPSEAEIQASYEQNKGRLGGASLEQSKLQLVGMLQQQQQQRLRTDVIRELKAATPIKILIEPPRLKVEEGGSPATIAKAPVTIIEFSDYQCPFCSRAEGTMKQIRETYGDKVRVVFRDYPLPFHKNAQKAAEAAGCANEQGKFWEMHEKLFSNQGALELENLKKYAGDLGLDQKKFDDCLDSGKRADATRKDTQDGQNVGVTGTPAFFVNGRFVNGARPFDDFAKLIDDELTAKGLPIPPKPAPAPAPQVAAPTVNVKPAAPAAAPGAAAPAKPVPVAPPPTTKK